jgi:hypothetical protein
MKRFIWNVLNWLDNSINHTIIDWFFDLFDTEDKDGADSFSFIIWHNTSYKFCNWVNIYLFEKWFPEDCNEQL